MKIQTLLPERDKLLHFLFGFVIFILASLFFDNWIALIIVTIIGAGKELLWDYWLEKGTPELADFIWTIAPAIILTLTS